MRIKSKSRRKLEITPEISYYSRQKGGIASEGLISPIQIVHETTDILTIIATGVYVTLFDLKDLIY